MVQISVKLETSVTMNESTLFVITCVWVLLAETNSANILGIVPSPSYSHQIAFRNLWKELCLRGHTVTIVTTDPLNDPTLTNLREINVNSAYDVAEKSGLIAHLQNNKQHFLLLMDFVEKVILDITDNELSHPEVKKLIGSNSDPFDVVLVEDVFPMFLAFANRFNCPSVVLSSCELFNEYHSFIGNPTHPVLYPDVALPFFRNLSFKERLISCFLEKLFVLRRYFKFYPVMDEVIKKHFGEGIPPLEYLMKNISLVLLNTNPILNGVRPYGPSTIAIGGGMHILPARNLSENIQKFLDDGKNGVIYFSLGSNVKSKDIKNETMQIILGAFREIPFRVLWKYEEKELEGKPDNVKIVQWAPQQDVLRHPNIRLFITQCGIQSVEEAILSYVPMIGIPFYGDQEQNLKNLEHKGIAIGLDYETFTKPDLKDAILKITSNKVYYEKVKEMGKLMLDQPMTGLERAVWWTEYVIRNKGAPYLRNPAIDIPTYQYFLLDVIAFLVGVMIVIILLSYWSLCLTIKSIKVLYSKVPKSKAD